MQSKSKHVREFQYDGVLIAVLMKKGFLRMGEHAVFISSPKSSLQLGAGIYPKNHVAEPHDHARHEVLKAHYEELIHLDSGRMKVHLFGDDRRRFASFIMQTGDTVHLISGGHSFEMLTDCRCIEVKQGPYTRQNKRFFSS